MNQDKISLEIIAPTVDEAIEKGLEQLQLPREKVEIEILDHGTKGIFGIGSRQARVRMSMHHEPAGQPKAPSAEKAEPAPPTAPPQREQAKPSEKPASPPAQTVPPPAGKGEEDILELSRKVVSTLLEKMSVHAKVTAQYVQDEENKGQKAILVNVQGNDLSILIGRRSETLNALQYITTLIVNKETNRMVSINIDIQGYLERRERQLRQLARRMADQAVKSGRRQILEPMPAKERRFLHMELRNHPDVITESIGEEPYRKVTIKLRKPAESSRKNAGEEEDSTSD